MNSITDKNSMNLTRLHEKSLSPNIAATQRSCTLFITIGESFNSWKITFGSGRIYTGPFSPVLSLRSDGSEAVLFIGETDGAELTYPHDN